VASTVLLLMVGILMGVTNAARQSIASATAKASTFRQARQAFDAVTRTLSQATLNTYWDYYDVNGATRPADDPATTDVDESLDFDPVRYGRASDLRFITGTVSDLGLDSPFNLLPGVEPNDQPNGTPVGVACFFQAPTGYELDVANTANPTIELSETALNTIGYFVDFNKDALFEPSILSNPSNEMRFRLMEFREPSNALRVYSKTSGKSLYTERNWFTESLSDADEGPLYTRVLADNILALVFLPKLSSVENISGLDPWTLAPQYLYDSSSTGQDVLGNEPLLNSLHQLPPVVEVIMVAIDDPSARRLNELSNNDPITFLGLDNLFVDASKLSSTDSDDTNNDLANLEAALIQNGLNYRIFSTEVQIKAAKWSVQ